MKKIKKILVLFSLVIFCFSFSSSNARTQKMVVFIHGTIVPDFFPVIPPFLYSPKPTALPSIKSWFREQVNTANFRNKRCYKELFWKLWDKMLYRIRFDEVHKYQPIGNTGLVKIGLGKQPNLLDEKNKMVNASFAQNFKKAFKYVEQDDTNYHFYTFGWIGNMSHEKRIKWAEVLYNSLLKQKNLLENNSDSVEIEIYAHSHGANLALNLAFAEDMHKNNLNISRLVMFALPVQPANAKCVLNPIFEKAYHIYASDDDVQIFDKGMSHAGRSQRRFDEEILQNPLPQKLVQIEVTANGISPSHRELWFLGTVSSDNGHRKFNLSSYRYNFPLYPYPVSLFAPILITILDTEYVGTKDILWDIENLNPNIQEDFLETPNNYQFNITDKSIQFAASLPA